MFASTSTHGNQLESKLEKGVFPNVGLHQVEHLSNNQGVSEEVKLLFARGGRGGSGRFLDGLRSNRYAVSELSLVSLDEQTATKVDAALHMRGYVSRPCLKCVHLCPPVSIRFIRVCNGHNVGSRLNVGISSLLHVNGCMIACGHIVRHVAVRDFGSLRAHQHEKLYTSTLGNGNGGSSHSSSTSIRDKTFLGNAGPGTSGSQPLGLFNLRCRDQNPVSLSFPVLPCVVISGKTQLRCFRNVL